MNYTQLCAGCSTGLRYMSLLSQSVYNLKGIEIRHTIGNYTVIQEK